MFYSTGTRGLNFLEKAILNATSWLRERLLPKLRVNDRGFESRYVCNNKHDAQRAAALWVKEEGTMRWIDSEVRAGDIFMDIGANIGVYTIAAAHRVGSGGKVYAFEPHKLNAVTLMQNVQLSKLSDRVEIFSFPLSESATVLRFNYASLASASSGSQLGHTRMAGGEKEFRPAASEMVASVSVDELIARSAIKAPTLVKIDVDGNELPILRGMKSLLSGNERPRAVQVEVNVGEGEPIEAFLAGCSYKLDSRHFTRPGEAKLKRGVPVEKIEFNAIFRPS